MNIDVAVEKDRIEELFNAKVSACEQVCAFGLCVVFKAKTDVTRGLRISNSGLYTWADLYRLSDDVPLVVFKNAYLGATARFQVTAGSSPNYRLKQDIFHRDSWDHERTRTTMIYSCEGVKRHVPTYYAQQASVQQAICELPRDGLSDSVISIMDEMTDEDYAFDFMINEKDEVCEEAHRRLFLSHEYGTFVRDVYRRVPKDQRYAHIWSSDSSDVVMHTNRTNTILHGRPGSKRDNPRNDRIKSLNFDLE